MKILIIKPSSFGDIIQSAPVAAALSRSYPGVEIKWLVFKDWEEAIGLFPDVSGRIVWDRRAGISEYFRVISEVRKERFDAVIDLQGLMRTAVIARFSDATKVIGVPGMKELSWLFGQEVFPESRNMNAVKRNLETVRYLTGKTFEPVFNLRVPVSAIETARKMLEQNGIGQNDKMIAFVPRARGEAKTWPQGYYDELAAMIQKNNYVKIVALGAAGDGEKLNNPEIIDLTGRTSILTLAAVLSMSGAAVGGDTGPVHLAAALGVPTVAIFGGSDIGETAPINPGVTLISKHLECSPCRTRPSCKDYPCLTGIKPEEVFDAILKIWKK